jgi:RimJ/RimL family protein N-acetyltransferase
MSSSWWPLFDLRIRTERLELRPPADADLADLAALAADGVHEPGQMPFMTPWTEESPAERARSTLRWNWQIRGAWKPEDWVLELVVVQDGTVVGTQGLSARDFAVLREVHSGSWLGLKYHGQGIGTAMRAAMLWLVFAGLGAEYACSGAFEDNAASNAVSRKLGYRDDGIDRSVRRGAPVVTRRFRLDRATWASTNPAPATIEGLDACLPLFGLAAPAAPAQLRT